MRPIPAEATAIECDTSQGAGPGQFLVNAINENGSIVEIIETFTRREDALAVAKRLAREHELPLTFNTVSLAAHQ